MTNYPEFLRDLATELDDEQDGYETYQWHESYGNTLREIADRLERLGLTES